MTPTRVETTKPDSDSAWAGRLRLVVRSGRQRCFAAEQFHEGALRVLRPHYLDDSGQVAYTVINPGGAYLGADRYLLDVTVGPGASALLTTQSATKVYRTPQGAAEQIMRVRLDAEAVLEYVPDQLIVYRGGSYRQRTVVDMEPSATLVLSEIITAGWDPEGAEFAYDDLSLRTEVRVRTPGGMRRLLVDHLRLAPGRDGALHGIGIMEGHSHTGQLLIADARLDDDLLALVCDLIDASETVSGVSLIGAGDALAGMRGWCVRSLACRTRQISALHDQIINLVRQRTRAQSPLRLRKY
ncbi:urease accessory protein UreD [Citricoccus muralis]|uniref:Urease accessory protein UreD n=1 Tax=Citricoccus muralis TaxID=169134 RepID=A0ABY8H7D2_9MICC|nr:urease accessory protein UreD [Citricoccus muralis]WFP17063.1 urease accessory protein UreD [Citricoccus muralis]